MRRMRSQNKERKLGSPFPLRFASEFRTKCAIKGLFKATGRFKKTGQTKLQNTSRNQGRIRETKKGNTQTFKRTIS